MDGFCKAESFFDVFWFVAVLRIQVVVVVAAFVWVLFVLLLFIVVGRNRGGQWGERQ